MDRHTRLSRTLSVATLGLGLWLMLSPAILSYQSLEATAQQTIIGLIVVLIGGVRLSLPQVHWPSWIVVILSTQLIILPLHIGVVGGLISWNATLVGLLLLLVSIRSASAYPLFKQPTLHQ